MLKILSIDVGQSNLALRIEKRENFQLESVDYFDVVDITGRDDLSKNKKVNSISIDQILYNLTTYLQKMTEDGYFDNLSYLLVEKQLGKASRNIRIQHHIASYFIILYPDVKRVSFNASNKTKYYTDEKMTYTQRKKWAINKATELCTQRNDTFSLEKINQSTKKDDLADTLVQMEVWSLQEKVRYDKKHKKK